MRVRHSARNLTDGGGLVLVRKLFDRMGLAGWIDTRTGKEKGFFRPSLMVEAWVVLLLYGGGVMSDLPLLDRRGVRRIFGCVRAPNPTTFGRWLRRAAERMVPHLDALLWHMVRRRWALSGGTPNGLTLAVDLTVVVRYGKKQAGAVVGYSRRSGAVCRIIRSWPSSGTPATAWACAGAGAAPTRPPGRRSESWNSWGARERRWWRTLRCVSTWASPVGQWCGRWSVRDVSFLVKVPRPRTPERAVSCSFVANP